MTFFVFCIVAAEVALMILEASALAKDGEVETAVRLNTACPAQMIGHC